MKTCFAIVVLGVFVAGLVRAGEAPPKTPGDLTVDDYFQAQTAEIARKCLGEIRTIEDWEARKGEYRRQFAEMLGLWPMPSRTDLKPVVTGKVDHESFTVEKLYFQSMPGLYVTANLYIPKGLTAPAPAILYVCGHGNIKKDGVSYGAKAVYEHHGSWFARNGYVCLIIDTLQLGEIEGIHHGLYREKMWWWISRGYTPAGVEAWNGMRAIDYLQSRPEVDGKRIGMTGRSGGGAYTWWVAALDERVQVAVPVAGMTDMQNQVVDGCIEGHCDCMFFTNTYRWDFAQVAALIAPRPLLISNSDKDTIFPLDGVVRVHQQVRRIYALHKATDKLGLLITEGPHKDTQELQVPAFRWFNRFLKGQTDPIEMVAVKLFQPEQLRVFSQLPQDQINTRIHDTFGPSAPEAKVPESKEEWESRKKQCMAELRRQCFAGWPEEGGGLDVRPISKELRSGIVVKNYEFVSQENVRLELRMTRRADTAGKRVILRILDGAPAEPKRNELAEGECIVEFAPRGIGPTAWGNTEKRQTHVARRFWLLGQSVDGMRVWDVRRAVQAIGSIEELRGLPICLEGRRDMAGVAVYAALFEPGVKELNLFDPPLSHRDGPQILNVLRVMDMPEAVAMAAQRCRVKIHGAGAWEYPAAVAKKLEWPTDQFHVMKE